MLKSFDVKRFDAYRRESWDLIAKGTTREKARGFGNMAQLIGMFLLAGASVDWLKSWLIGRETTWSDELENNLWKLFTLNRYNLMRGVAKDDSALETTAKAVSNAPSAAANWILPPFSWATLPAKDLAMVTDKIDKGEQLGWADFESWRMFPVVGSSVYYRAGPGNERKRAGSGTRRSRSGARSPYSY
jgi:hypothetical protein